MYFYAEYCLKPWNIKKNVLAEYYIFVSNLQNTQECHCQNLQFYIQYVFIGPYFETHIILTRCGVAPNGRKLWYCWYFSFMQMHLIPYLVYCISYKGKAWHILIVWFNLVDGNQLRWSKLVMFKLTAQILEKVQLKP